MSGENHQCRKWTATSAPRTISFAPACRRRRRACTCSVRARGTARRWSDIDIAVEPLKPLPPGLLSELREALAESGLLLDVDLIDLSAADAPLAASVRSEGIPWND